MTKMNAHLVKLAAVVASAVLLGTTASASIVFDAPASSLNRAFSAGNSVEFGDQVFLSGSDRRVSDFQFDYFVSTNANGNELAEIFFYDNNGTNGAPGTMLYRSGEFSLGSGFNTVIAQQLSTTVGNTFTWTVVFKGIDTGESAGLVLASTPTVGGSLDDFWVKNTDGSWSTFLVDGGATPGNFVARITAVPEPSTYALLLLGGLALGYRSYRRRS